MTTLTTARVGRWGLEVDQYDERDPRGQLLVWEPPLDSEDYICGVDPTMGILGWNRQLRTDDEEKHDNAALEVFRRGRWIDEVLKLKDDAGNLRTTRVPKKLPDVQVAEWAGPLDAEDLAYVCNFVGRMFPGSSEERQALMAIEVAPGPGWLTQRVLHDQLATSGSRRGCRKDQTSCNATPVSEDGISNATPGAISGFVGPGISSVETHLNSKHLVEEMVACRPDNFLALTARASAWR